MQEKISLTWWVYVHVGVREIHLFPIDASAFEMIWPDKRALLTTFGAKNTVTKHQRADQVNISNYISLMDQLIIVFS